MSLRRTCRDLVLDAVLRRVAASDGDESTCRLQVIVDETTLKILNSFLRMSDLHEKGVTSVEIIENPREPLPELDALYMLRPTLPNIEKVLEDFRAGGVPQHRQVHLAFSQAVLDELMLKLASNAVLTPRVKSLVEVPLSFVTIQDRGFHFDMIEAVRGLFPVPDPMLVSDIVLRLADVCRCLQGAFPSIRHANNGLCKGVAEKLQGALSRTLRRDGVPTEVLIVDRSMDMAAALIHEYTYEAMMYDLLDGGMLDVDRNIVTLKGPPDKEVLLSDADPLWEDLKHRHLEDAKRVVDLQVEQVRQLHQTKEQSPTEIETSDLLEMLRKTPEQKEAIERLSLHASLIQKLFEKLQTEQLHASLGFLEQDIACGVDASGKDVKATNLQGSLAKVLSELDANLSSETRLRMLMLYWACVANVSEVARQKLLEMAHLSSDDQYVLMEMLRTKLMEVPESQRHKHSSGTGAVHRVTKEQAARFKKNAKTEGRIALSRFEPRMKEILEALEARKLGHEDFPALPQAAVGGLEGPRSAGSYAGASPAAPAAQAVQAADSWSFSPTSKSVAATEVSQRVVVFVIGGITYSELRVASEVARKLPRGNEVLIGGTALLTPRLLIRALHPKEVEGDQAKAEGGGEAAAGAGAGGRRDPTDLT
mmetsp:Transcript_7161/g.15558  ORF Transcript_7161/g.15558 Transcript_7161/m.15558 type:complete len:650 (-) Transcript_7161:98-2047(-)